MNDDLRKDYPFASDLLDIINGSSEGEEQMLADIEDYFLASMSDAADMVNKEILLGHIALYGPNDWDDWTTEEKLELFDRWEIIDKLVALSKLNNLYRRNEEHEDKDDNTGGGMIS